MDQNHQDLSRVRFQLIVLNCHVRDALLLIVLNELETERRQIESKYL